MFDDLLKTQRKPLPERLLFSAVLPSLLVTSLMHADAFWAGPTVSDEYIAGPASVCSLMPDQLRVPFGPGVFIGPANVVEMLPTPTRRGGVVSAHLPVFEPAPAKYSDALMKGGIPGRVVVRAVIDTFGRAIPGSLAIVESRHAVLNRGAVLAVRDTRFYQARLYGIAGEAVIEVSVDVIFPD